MTHTQDAPLLFEVSDYAGVVALLRGRAHTGREQALLGISLLRTGELGEAELPLLRASVLGDDEGAIEYGNLLRLTGRFDEAARRLEAISSTVQDTELKFRAWRWWGVSDFQAGRTEAGVNRTERAWHGYVALGDDALSARVAQSLAQMYLLTGQPQLARRLLQDAVRALPVEPDSAPRLTALKSLLDLQVSDGDFSGADETLLEVRRTLRPGAPKLNVLYLNTSIAELHRLRGDERGYELMLDDLQTDLEGVDDYGLQQWVTSRVAEHQSLRHQHGAALRTLHAFQVPMNQWPAALWATDGVLRRRRGDYPGGYDSLGRAVALAQEAGDEAGTVRALLHRAACALEAGNALPDHEREAARLLQEAMTLLLRLKSFAQFRPDLEELHHLMAFAVLDPDTAPYVEPLMDEFGQLTGQHRLVEDGAMRLQLTTLGKVSISRDGQALSFLYLHTPLLLAYLHLHPNRTRAEIQRDLFPERDAKTASSYARQCIWDLRDKLGAAVVRFEGPHHAPRYRLGHSVQVELDYEALLEATSRNEVVRALSLYRGPFMAGMEESEWVMTRRDEALLALGFELRQQMAVHRQAGDLRRVVMFANQLLKHDPLNCEVLQERVEAARTYAAPSELARYVAQLNRFLN